MRGWLYSFAIVVGIGCATFVSASEPLKVAVGAPKARFDSSLSSRRHLIQALLENSKSNSKLSDFITLTGFEFSEKRDIPSNEDAPNRVMNVYTSRPNGNYWLEFVERSGVADRDAEFYAKNSNGYDLYVHIIPEEGVGRDVTKCLSLADVRYYATISGFTKFELDSGDIDHGFTARKHGLRLFAYADGVLGQLKIKDKPRQSEAPMELDYLKNVYAFEGCVTEFEISGYTQLD